jgi:hypothetical protein
MKGTLRRLTMLGMAVVAIFSVREQLARRPDQRTWHGDVWGIPYDYRIPTLERAQQRLWNPDDEHLIVPHVFGIGWTVNFYQLKELLGPWVRALTAR